MLSATGSRKTRYELTRWLEADADARDAGEVVRAQAFRCDAGTCVAKVKGIQLTVTNSAQESDACTQPGILVLKVKKPEGCAPPGGMAIDAQDLARLGAHALTVENGQLRRETVADARGVRPWSRRAAADQGE
jgi:hypothetical protein